jgi:hypothetical protein
MIRLLIFAACEKVILADKGQSSLIGVVEEVRVTVGSEPLPNDALVPFRWTFISLWYREQELEEPLKYEIEVRMTRPDGQDAGFAGRSEFEVNNQHQNFRQLGEVPVIPAGIEGTYFVRLFLRKLGESEWQEKAAYPVVVKYEPEQANPVQSASP